MINNFFMSDVKFVILYDISFMSKDYGSELIYVYKFLLFFGSFVF